MNDMPDKCTICLESLLNNGSSQVLTSVMETAYGSRLSPVCILPMCNHIFHSSCLIPWAFSSRSARLTCPNCRARIYLDQNEKPLISFIPQSMVGCHTHGVSPVKKENFSLDCIDLTQDEPVSNSRPIQPVSNTNAQSNGILEPANAMALLHRDLALHREMMENLQEDFDLIVAENEDMREENDRLQAEIDDLQAQVDENLNSKDLEAEVDSLKVRLQSAEKETQRQQALYQELNKLYDTSQSKRIQAEKRASVLEQEIRKLKGKIKANQEKLDAIRSIQDIDSFTVSDQDWQDMFHKLDIFATDFEGVKIFLRECYMKIKVLKEENATLRQKARSLWKEKNRMKERTEAIVTNTESRDDGKSRLQPFMKTETRVAFGHVSVDMQDNQSADALIDDSPPRSKRKSIDIPHHEAKKPILYNITTSTNRDPRKADALSDLIVAPGSMSRRGIPAAFAKGKVPKKR